MVPGGRGEISYRPNHSLCTKYDHILVTLPMAVLDSVQDVVQRLADDTADA